MFGLCRVFAPRRRRRTTRELDAWLVESLESRTLLTATHINEVFVNPPGTDTGNEYIELRGTPSTTVAANTYLVAIEGDSTGAGTIDKVFPLSGLSIGSNGFLVLLQAGNTYTVDPNSGVATAMGTGWETISDSINDIENGSNTLLLITSATPPTAGGDVDSANNGTLDGEATGWTIIDSIGNLDGGTSDFAYAAINFSTDANGTSTTGTIIDTSVENGAVGFTPDYLARIGNSTGSTLGDWLAADVNGTGPIDFAVDPLESIPNGVSNALDHIGAMNPVFSAAAGVTVTETGGSTDIAEEMATTDTYDIALKSVPAGSVEITATADAQAELSLNGTDFFAAVMLTFTDMTPQTVTVRAIEDGTPEATPHSGTITHAVTTTNDPADYPLSTTIADVIANIEDNDTPGVTITETSGSTDVDEQGQTTDTFDVSLDTAPAGNVTVRLQITDGETEISTNGGVSYGTEFFLNFTDTTPQTITVRPIDDSDFEGPHTGSVLLDISATNDLGDYPTGPAGSLTVNITDNDFMPPPTDLYLNEVVVDLDGVGDNPNEYIEVRGPAGAPLAGIYLLMVDGDGAASGDVDAVIDLTSYSIGSDGFLVIVDDAADLYTISPGTSIVDVPGLDFENASYSALLLHNGGGPVPTVGGDLDVDNDGLDPLPPGYTIVDGVSALDGTVGDRGYAPIVFSGTAEGLTETGATFVDTGFGSDDVIHMMRIGDSIGSTTADWVAFELDDASVPPDFLIEFSTDPAYEVGAVITDHLGASNPTSAMAPALHVIIDNGDVGYSTVGTWASNVNAAARDGDIENSLFGRGQNVASWNFTGLTPGNYRVSATWVEHPNRATNSPFRAVDSDGTTILNATTIDQEVAPDDFMDDGTLWEDLFVVTATGTELTIELSNAANQYVVADAIRIVPTADPASPFAPIIDNGDPGFASSGSWNTPSGILGHQNDLIHHAPGSTGDTATWTFTGLTPGNYYVSATWLASANRSMEAPFTIIDGPGGPTVEIAIVDQTIAPDDFSDQGSMWEQIALVTITGTELLVELTDSADGYVIADAIRVEATTDLSLPPGTIIDNGDGGFGTTAGFSPSLFGNGHEGDLLHAPAGDGSSVATWTFSGLTAGDYRVSATWFEHPNRATNAGFVIRDGIGGPILTTVMVDQTLAPNDFTTFGSYWEDLLTVTITGTDLVVELSNDANGFVIADALRVQPVIT